VMRVIFGLSRAKHPLKVVKVHRTVLAQMENLIENAGR